MPAAGTVFMTRKPLERAAILREFRKQIGYSQDQLATNVKLSTRTIQRAERDGVASDDTWIALGHLFKQPTVFFQQAPIPNYAQKLMEQLRHPECIAKWDPITHENIAPGQGHLARLNRYEADLWQHASGAGWTLVTGDGGGDMIIRRDTDPLLRAEGKRAFDEALVKRFATIGLSGCSEEKAGGQA
jgi:DNA-binding XRE family transcriptional regulator